MQDNFDKNRPHLTPTEAAKITQLSPVYLRKLLREGKIEGFRAARDWILYEDSLNKFLAIPRKPGPKGPRKKPRLESSVSSASN